MVRLNGRRLQGNTPYLGVKVSAGRHLLHFENRELGLSRTMRVRVPAGRTKTVAINLSR